MIEALLRFIQELLFRNDIIDIRDKRFNVFSLLPKIILIVSIFLNYYLLHRYIILADNHYKLSLSVSLLENHHPECAITYDPKEKNYSIVSNLNIGQSKK